jgi:alkaline phosphatase D
MTTSADQHFTFPQGISSGEPTASSIVLWTRALPDVPVECGQLKIRVEISTDRTFTGSLCSGKVKLRRFSENYRQCPDDFTVRVMVKGLRPNQHYFYRFVAPTGDISEVGTFQTLDLPTADTSIKFVVLSCANIPPFEVLDAVVREPNVRFFSFNGDNIYADLAVGVPDLPPPYNTLNPNVIPADPIVPSPELIEFYRNVYRIQRSATTLGGPQWLSILKFLPGYFNWDDHEIIDNYAGNVGQTNLATQNLTGIPHIVEADKRAGYRAWFEYNAIPKTFKDPILKTIVKSIPKPILPLKDLLFRRQRINKHVELFILDERQYRSSEFLRPIDPLVQVLPPVHAVTDPFGQPLTREQLFIIMPILNLLPPELVDTIIGPPGYSSPIREQNITMLGQIQFQWLQEVLVDSDATLKFIINEVAFGNFFTGIQDNWLGYFKERQRLLHFLEENDMRNVVFLTGDLHAGVINQVNAKAAPFPIWEVITGPVGHLTLAFESELHGVPPLIFTEFLNAFRSPPEFGGLTPVSPDAAFPTGYEGSDQTLQFMVIDTPNYMTVEVIPSNGSATATISLKDATGNVIIDPHGRTGVLTITL